MTKALELLKSNQSVAERAEQFVTSIERELRKAVIDPLIDRVEKINDELYELKNFTLNTNVNAGLAAMTKDECQARFKKIIDLEFELTLVQAELKVKSKSFKTYFTDGKSTR